MLKIGDLAKLFNVSVKTIRFYEKKGLLNPAEIDVYTGYRYYDENNIKRLSEIIYLKKLGFSLKEIANFNENQIISKTKQLASQIEEIYKNIRQLNLIYKNNEGEFMMQNFINDPQVIGKWERVCVVDSKEEFLSGKYKDQKDIFSKFQNIYCLENGQGYWCFDYWSKGILKFFNIQKPFEYEIENDLMFLTMFDKYSNEKVGVAVYRKVDNKIYTLKDISHIDNLNIPFENDEKVLGLWKSVDFLEIEKNYIPGIQQWTYENGKLPLTSLSFLPDGKLIVSWLDNSTGNQKWTKNLVLLKRGGKEDVACHYEIKNIQNKNYMYLEWKSGDYTFGGYITHKYVLEKIS